MYTIEEKGGKVVLEDGDGLCIARFDTWGEAAGWIAGQRERLIEEKVDLESRVEAAGQERNRLARVLRHAKMAAEDEVNPPKLTRHEAERARKKLDTLDGKGPGGKLNFAYGDGYFAVSIKREFGMPVEDLRKEVDRVLGTR